MADIEFNEWLLQTLDNPNKYTVEDVAKVFRDFTDSELLKVMKSENVNTIQDLRNELLNKTYDLEVKAHLLEYENHREQIGLCTQAKEMAERICKK